MKLFTTVLLLLVFSSVSLAQSGTLTGTIVTSDGQPAAGVTVRVKGHQQMVISEETGRFVLTGLKAGSYQLEISLVGYKTISRQVTLTDGANIIDNLKLELSHAELQEVIVDITRQKMVRNNSDYVAKMPLKNLENAQVYTVISQELMQQQLAFNVEDAMKNVPGVSKLWDATNRVGSGGTWFVSRGFSVQPRARNGVAGNINSAVDVNNLERIEVIKGPSATLFGNIVSAYGGLINRVTKKPYEEFGGAVDYAGGSFGFNRLSADVNTPLDKKHSLLMRTTAAFTNQANFQDFGYGKSYAFAPSLSYKVNDRLSLQFDAELTGTENSSGTQIVYFLTPSMLKSTLGSAMLGMGFPEATVNAILATAPSTMKEAYGTDRADELKLDYRRSYLSNDLVNKTQSSNFFGDIKYKISAQWTSQTLVARGASSSNGPLPYLYLLPNALPSFINSVATGTPAFGTGGHDQMARMVWRINGNENNLQLQQNFLGDFTIGKLRNRFVGGLDYYEYNSRTVYDRFTGSVYGFPFPDAFDIVNTSGSVPNYQHLNKAKVDSAFASGASSQLNYNSNIRTYSAFVNDVLNITDQLIVSAGLRVDHFSNKGAYDPITGNYNGNYNQTALAPKFGLIYQLWKDQVSVFGNYQSSFTNQTNANPSANEEPFKPEKAFQWETGVKVNLLGNKLTGSVSYYDILVKDKVRSNPANPMTQIQDGEQASKGWEVELQAVPVDGLNIVAGFGNNKSELRNATPDVEGLRPTDAGPKYNFNLWAAYTFRNGALKGLGFGFGGNKVGEAYAINSNVDGQFILPAYTVLNASVMYDQPRFRITAKVNNIADEKYWVGWTTFNPQMPRQFIGSLALKF